MAIPIRSTDPPDAAVEIDGDDVLILALRVSDADLLDVVRDHEKPVQAVESCLRLGARVLRSAHTTIDTALVEERFGALERRVGDGLDRAEESLGNLAERYLDPENGSLRAMLAELEKTLGDTFDPKRKESVLAKFEELLTKSTREMTKAVYKLVDPGDKESPLGRLKDGLGADMKDLRDTVEELRAQVQADQAAGEILELTAIKGRRFEEVVFEATAAFVSAIGDTAEAVGDDAGTGGGRVGDVLVSLDDSLASGQHARYVVEAKDRKLSLREALRELDRAIKNRDALAGVIVFSSPEKAPIAGPVQLFASKAIVVLDKDDPDPRPLRLALASVRIAVQQQLRSVDDGADLDAIIRLVEQARSVLDCHTTIKRFHAGARKQIDGASGQVAGLVEQLDEILAQIRRRLSE